MAVYDVSEEDESALDGWEAADSGLYRKTKVRVSTLTGEMVVWTYVLDAYEGGLPSASYVGVLADAAEAADAPDDYVAAPPRACPAARPACSQQVVARLRGCGRPPRRCCRPGRGRTRRSRPRGTPARTVARAGPRRRSAAASKNARTARASGAEGDVDLAGGDERRRRRWTDPEVRLLGAVADRLTEVHEPGEPRAPSPACRRRRAGVEVPAVDADVIEHDAPH